MRLSRTWVRCRQTRLRGLETFQKRRKSSWMHSKFSSYHLESTRSRSTSTKKQCFVRNWSQKLRSKSSNSHRKRISSKVRSRVSKIRYPPYLPSLKSHKQTSKVPSNHLFYSLCRWTKHPKRHPLKRCSWWKKGWFCLSKRLMVSDCSCKEKSIKFQNWNLSWLTRS